MRSICTSVVAIASFCITGTSLGDYWGTELTASDGASTDEFNYAAIDGDTCVIGAWGTNSGTGSAYVFTLDASGNWSQIAELTASDGASGDGFGYRVAMEGGTCVIGAPNTNSYVGSAYVYTSDASGTWSQVAELNGESQHDYFGSSVAIDGDTCVIGATGTNSNAGNAYVFTPDASGVWSQVTELTASDGASNDLFGGSVAIDGDTCVIGAQNTNSYAGSAYVYTSDASGNWSQVAELTASNEASNDYFGKSIAIDGDTCVIGAWGTNSGTGSAYVFTSDASGDWSQVGELTGSDGASNDFFGGSVAMDGDTCVIGAEGTNSYAGSAYIYTSDASGTWSQVAELTASDGASNDFFGGSVAIDGGICVIGAYGTNSSAGSAYVYGSTGNEDGACCYDSLCFSITEAECNAVGGTYATSPCSADTDCPESCGSDSDNDGDVDIEDLLNLIGAFGACP